MADVLAVFAHPDDEVLGCGGTLAKHAENGDTVFVRILSTRNRELSTNASEAFLALGLNRNHDGKGPEPFFCGGVPDQKFVTLPVSELLAPIGYVEGLFPDIVYTHHPEDLNLDHALTAKATLVCYRPKPNWPKGSCRIMACEVASSTEYTYPRVFQPNWYEGLSDEQTSKASEALRCYESELEIWPHPRSQLGIVHRAKVRGSEVGVEFAEAFQLLRAGPF